MEEKEIRALVSLLNDRDEEILAHVSEKLLELGGQAIPFLEEEWEQSLEDDVQERIEDLVQKLQFQHLKTQLREWKSEGGTDLLKGVWLLATFQYPDLEYQSLLERVEQVYYDTWLAMTHDNDDPFQQVKVINRILYEKYRFSANTKNFHSPANSMMNQVLTSRKGNPIALCVLYILVAQKMKLPVYGVNLPNLFILTYKDEFIQFYINAFNKGAIFTKDDIDSYLSHLNLSQKPIFYEPCDNLAILRRMMRNLLVSYEKLGETEKVDQVEELLRCLEEGEDVGQA